MRTVGVEEELLLVDASTGEAVAASAPVVRAAAALDEDLDQFASVSLWCDRFDVSFGAAALA